MERASNEYSPLRKYSSTTRILCIRITRFAGHCYRSEEEIIKDVLLWTPNHGTTKLGRWRKSYVKQLCDHTGLTTKELKIAMKDRTTWTKLLKVLEKQCRPGKISNTIYNTVTSSLTVSSYFVLIQIFYNFFSLPKRWHVLSPILK